MQINETSIMCAILVSSLLMGIIHLGRKKILDFGRGISVFIVLVVIVLLRLILPVELPPMEEVPLVSVFHPIMFLLHEKILWNLSCAEILVIIWAVVASILLVSFMVMYIRFIHDVIKTSIHDDVLDHIFSTISTDKRCRTKIFYNESTEIPFSAGVIKRMIIIPKDTEMADLQMIVRHELTHIKNGDLVIKLCMNIICCVFWFNPFVYKIRKDLVQTLEIRCDRAVTLGMNDAQRARYLEVLLSVLRRNGNLKRKYINSALFEGDLAVSNIKERFENVEAGKARNVKSILVGAIMMIVVLSLICLSYMFSSKQYRAAAKMVYEIEVIPDTVPLETDQKLRLINLWMKDYDIDGDFIDPVTGIAGMLVNDIPLEERHVIIDVPEKYRQMMFDETMRNFVQEKGTGKGDTSLRSEVFREYQQNTRKKDRLKGTWTLEQYERAYSQAFYDACREYDSVWEAGKEIPAGALDGITRGSIDNSLVKGIGEYGEILVRE